MKPELYRQICDRLHHLLGDENDFIANAANTSALLFQSLPDINWAGFYIARESELVLGPFQGKPACVRIALGKGVCGTAAVKREVLVVPDVFEFPGHIFCDGASRSEVVVPLVQRNALLGVLDIDSPHPGRFDAEDQAGLEPLAAAFMQAL
ncbi:MAG: GAF domain-containing protein [Bryobacteraceae bacterium]